MNWKRRGELEEEWSTGGGGVNWKRRGELEEG